jgi:hypothetical protein
MIYINAFFAVSLAYMSVDLFREGRDNLGWMYVIGSAMNAATVAASIL